MGLITTVAACFPALVMKLLDFVALYGLILMPMGAIIFMDFYLLRRLNLQPEYARVAGIKVNWAAALTWILTMAFALVLNQAAGIEVFFLGLPGWFVAAAAYLLLSRFLQRQPQAAPKREPATAEP